MHSERVVVDLFCGAGGASAGFKQAGFDVKGAVDIDEDAMATYEENLDIQPYDRDLSDDDVTFSEIRDHFDIGEDEVDVISGCPPCQNFSSLRDTTPWPDNEPKDELLQSFLDLVDEEHPPMVFFENVPGILTSDGGQYAKYWKDKMNSMNYGFDFQVVNTAQYGVPQERKRAVGLCVLDADHGNVTIPEPTHGLSSNPDNDLEPWVTVKDAIGHLPAIQKGATDPDDNAHRSRRHRENTMKIIRNIPHNGGSRHDLPDELELDCHSDLDDGTSAGNVYGRMEWEKPSPTLTTRCTTPSCGRFIHPEQDRSITFREAANLMTLDNYVLPDKNQAAERVVGNAVPPKFVSNLISEFMDDGYIRKIL